MLNVMRDNLRHLKWLLWIVALSMVAYLGAFFTGNGDGAGGGSWAVRIDDNEISVNQFLNEARNIDRYYQQLFGTNYEQFKSQVRIGSQAARSLIERQLILDDAYELGLTVSDTELAEAIRSDPNLQDPDGQFIGTDRYVEIVSRVYAGGVTAYELSLADDILLDKWTDLVTQAARVSPQEVERAYRQRVEKSAIDYVVVPSSEQDVEMALDDSSVREWYDAHQEDYRRADARRVRYVLVDREAQAAAIEITEEDLFAAYEESKAGYSHPEQRRARHILFRTTPGGEQADTDRLRQQAEEVHARLTAGEDFATLARTMSQDPGSAQTGGDLGFFGQGDMVPPFEQAVWATAPGQLAPVVQTDFGFHVIEVTEVREAGVVPLHEVREELERTLRLRRAQESLLSESERLRAALAAEAFDDVAAREGLEVQSRLISEGELLADLGASPGFAEAIFALEPGQVSDPLGVRSGLSLVMVDELVPSSVPPLEEIETRVGTDVLNDRARRAAVAAAERALQGKGDFAALAASLNKDVVSSGDLAPGQSLAGAGATAAALGDRLFGDDVQSGDRGMIEVPAGALIYEVTRRERFDPADFAEAEGGLQQELLAQRQNQLRQSVVEQLRGRREILINQELISQLDG